MRDCKPSAILRRLGCPLWLAEHPCTSAFSGLWTYTTRWDATPTGSSLQSKGATLIGKTGERVQFGCSHRIRHTPVAPLLVLAGGLFLRFVIVYAGQVSRWGPV